MSTIGRKIYYDKATGNILVDTGERTGSVVETTIEQDFQAFIALAERVPDTVGVIRLDYGQYAQDFQECNGYRINTATNSLEFSYPDPNQPDPEEPPAYRVPLTTQVAFLIQENVKLTERLAQVTDDNIFILETLISNNMI